MMYSKGQDEWVKWVVVFIALTSSTGLLLWIFAQVAASWIASLNSQLVIFLFMLWLVSCIVGATWLKNQERVTRLFWNKKE